MARHDPSTLPISKLYKLTVNNIGSGLVMATPWRTITSFTPPPKGQVVVDIPQQQVFFVATVREGEMPALLWARLKVEDRKISELEIYLGRSKADSGMQFEPDDLAHLPPEWSVDVPRSKLPSREELATIGRSYFVKDVLNQDIPGAPNCKLAENGHVVKDWPVVSYITSGTLSKEDIRTGEVEIPCGAISKTSTFPLGSKPLYGKARYVIDEDQGIVVALAMVPGKSFPNFIAPPPGPNPKYPTAFVPDSFTTDQATRMAKLESQTAKADGPVAYPIPEVMAVVEMHRVYDGLHQAEERLLQAQPVGSGSPWDLK